MVPLIVMATPVVMYFIMSHLPLQAYTSATVSSSLDVWGFGVTATKVFLGRNLDEQRRDVRGHES